MAVAMVKRMEKVSVDGQIFVQIFITFLLNFF